MLWSTHSTEEPLLRTFGLLFTVIYSIKVLIRMNVLVHALRNSFVVVPPSQSGVQEVFLLLLYDCNRVDDLRLNDLEGRQRFDFLF
jgi:hypothetical protein